MAGAMNTTEELLEGDELRTCVDCRATFLFAGHERVFYQDSGYVPPKRCRACRFTKRQRYLALEREARGN
jgi:hypothetical protein